MEAERLDSKEIIIGDTAALAKTIRTLGSLGRVFAHDDLAKAYYYLGRNFHNMNDYSTAADYYIEADRLQTTDLVLRGRINSCMGFICKQDSVSWRLWNFMNELMRHSIKSEMKDVLQMD